MRALSILKTGRTIKLILSSSTIFTMLAALTFAPGPVIVVSHAQGKSQTRQTVFINPNPIIINDAAPASPYPSTITVSGVPGTIPSTPGSVKVTLCSFNHSFSDDIGIVLVGPTSAALLLQDGAGDDPDMNNITYTLSDTGATTLPDLTDWAAGTYKPTNYFTGSDFPIPGPGTSYNEPGPTGSGTATFSSTFGGTNPNGTWSLYVVDFVSADFGSIGCGWRLEITSGSGTTGLHVVDFDGDGKTDPALVRNTGGGASGQITWFIQNSLTGTLTFVPWGIASDFFVPEDYDGDNRTDVAVWRPGAPSNSFFYILQSSTGTLRTDQFGQLGDDPTVVGDYDGDAKSDPAVYRAGASAGDQSFWHYRASAGPMSGQVISTQWGQNGDAPVPGDFDGDGINDFAIRRNAGGGGAIFFFNQSTAGQTSLIYGRPTDLIVPGDYDADGKTDIATIRNSGGQMLWNVRSSMTGASTSTFFGAAATDFATQGDWDGDGKIDIAVWRPNADPANNFFYWLRSSDGGIGAFEWGNNGDYPVANYNAH